MRRRRVDAARLTVRLARVFVAGLFAPGCVESTVAPVDATVEAGACGVSSAGECRGAQFVRCGEGTEVLVDDCADAGGQCVREGVYATCAVPVGARCRGIIDHGSHQHLTFSRCLGDGVGCVTVPDDGHCRASVGACVEGDVGRCRGALLVASCRAGQTVAVDCAAHGGRCDPAMQACVDVPRGGVCDGTLRRCAAGTECRRPFRRALFGRCEPPQ